MALFSITKKVETTPISISCWVGKQVGCVRCNAQDATSPGQEGKGSLARRSVDGPCNRRQAQKKGRSVYDSIDAQCVEQANPWRRSLVAAWGRGCRGVDGRQLSHVAFLLGGGSLKCPKTGCGDGCSPLNRPRCTPEAGELGGV